MPARKPMALNQRRRKDIMAERTAAELSMTPISDLPERPAALRGYPQATAAWDKLMQLYAETSAEIITAFDEELLVQLCMTSQAIIETRKLRASAMAVWKVQEKKWKAAKKSEALYLSQVAANALDGIARMDARLDNRIKLWHTLAQSLYLTPRARAGYIPPKKPTPVSRDEMDEILGTLE